MLNWGEYEKSFITSGPGIPTYLLPVWLKILNTFQTDTWNSVPLRDKGLFLFTPIQFFWYVYGKQDVI